MNEFVLTFFAGGMITSAMTIILKRSGKREQDTHEKMEWHDKLPTRYFYCVQNKDELPEWDPITVANELFADAQERVSLYRDIEFPLVMLGGQREKARYYYIIERMNFTHLSATLNQMILLLNTLGKTYPDVLQFSNKIIRLRLEVDDEHKHRRFLCAANRFTKRLERACHLAYGGAVPFHKRERLTWSEIDAVFVYTDEELLS